MGQVLIEKSPSPMKLEVLNVDHWSIDQKAEGEVEFYYEDTETSLIIEGAGEIRAADGTSVGFSAGDLVTIMPGTRCVWHITEAIERHYHKG